ncbi:DEAD/DEAH box helicase family protein [Candidatus Electronema sp. JC]|uniref:DEAD/DEAH box helicase family protein n=1 Tax=Candidatus Electronema sp. JC TaxID=3401570 RepID=UPI003B433B53
MGYEPLVKQNPLRVLKLAGNDRKMGLIMARTGLGKTALLVQIALESILRGKRVLHISIGESLDKTKLWYDDMLQAVLQECPVARPHELIDMVRQHRMIMTFKAGAFDRERLEERLHDLIQQNIFTPDCVVIDGFDFTATDHAKLEDVKKLMEELKLQTWFSATSHRDDPRVSPSGVPAPCHELDDLFENVILLKPEQDHVVLQILRDKGKKVDEASHLGLDPATMLVRQD